MKEIESKFNNIMDKLSEIYIAIMLIIFPLCVDSTGFFKILECKYRYFLIIATTYLALSIIILAYYYIFHKFNYFKDKKLTKIQYAVIIFWIINCISCFLSPYLGKYNLFVGVGRRRRINKYIIILFNIFSNNNVWTIKKKIYNVFFDLININKYNSYIAIHWI